MKSQLRGKHLLSTADWSNEEIETLLITAEKLKELAEPMMKTEYGKYLKNLI